MGDDQCRLLWWKGGCLQKLATPQMYVALFGIIGFCEVAINSYQVAILSTVEKMYKIPSKQTGVVISGVDIGTLVCVSYLIIYGKKLHKPRAVAFGLMLSALACVLWLLPHFIYGPNTTLDSTPSTNLSHACEYGDLPNEICEGGNESLPSTVVFLLGNIAYGTGACFYWVLGFTYIDDNAKKSKAAFYLSVTMLIRMFGPTFGFMLASYSLKINIGASTNLNENDPRWIGAWWLGFAVLSVLLSSLVLFIGAFPRKLPKSWDDESDSVPADSDMFKDFRLTAGRLFRNKVFVFNTISSTLYVFGLSGMGTFGPKYLELQFHLTSSEASLAVGMIGLVCTGLGVLSSGIAITYWKPSGASLALWNVICEALDVIAYFMFAFLGCPTGNLQGHWRNDNEWDLFEECNKFCSCPPTIKYTPVCSDPGEMLFFSPCHAGCGHGSLNLTSQSYENCQCAPPMSILRPGPCPVTDECRQEFYIYFALLSLLTFLSASGRAGNTLLQVRSVKKEDKAVSIAVAEGLMSIFAFIPSPIIFGFLLDYTCIVWGESCGKTENCWLYNSKSMRYIINFTVFGFLLFGTMADVVVWAYSSDVEMYDKEEVKKEEPAQKKLLSNDSRVT